MRTPLNPPPGVRRTSASGLDLLLRALRGRALFSNPLLTGVSCTGVESDLFSGVDLTTLTRSTSDSFLFCRDIERRPAMVEEDVGSVLMVERRGRL